MGAPEKPYRKYRGGRQKGRVPSVPRPERKSRAKAGADRGDRRDYSGTSAARAGRPRRGRRIGIALALLLAFAVVWGLASYLAFRGGVHDANKRLGASTKAALAPQNGLLLSKPSNTLLLGTDTANIESRRGLRHSDSIMLVRTDPDTHRIAYLSIPRDLYVDIPGHGRQKINTAYQIGGAPLAIRTVSQLTSLPIHHVALVQFEDFQKLIDDLGGVTVDVPKAIVSNRFDCPYSTEVRCREWNGWRFAKGKQTMTGRRALVYARIRENRLDPAENDLTRGERQQQVLHAISSKLTSPVTVLKMPFVGGSLLSPLATDLSPWQFVQLGWLKFRSGGELRCRLGGTTSYAGGQSVIEYEQEDLLRTVLMFMGRSAPQPPRPGETFGAGCVT